PDALPRRAGHDPVATGSRAAPARAIAMRQPRFSRSAVSDCLYAAGTRCVQHGGGKAGRTDTAGRPRRIYRARARLTADSPARREAVTVLVSTPTPHRACPPTSHSTYAAAWASLPAESACSV